MEPQTTICTLRHAHTDYNTERRYAGSLDIPLSEAGIRDAQMAAKSIARNQFDVVVSSPLKRAVQTARILMWNGAPLVRSKLCVERRFGIMEGLTWDEVQDLNPPILMIRVGNDLHTVNPRNGEPFEAVWDRAKAFRRFLFGKHAGQTILVVSHGVFLQLFHGLLRGLSCIESLAFFPANLELTRFVFSGERLVSERVEVLGDPAPRRW